MTARGPSSLAKDRRPVGERRALRAVGVQFWVNGMVFSSFVPRLPEIRTRLAIDLDEVGLLLTIGSLGGLVASGLCGRLIERLGTRVTMTIGAAGLVLVLPAIGFVDRPVALVAVLLALQFFDVLTDVAMNMQGSWLSARRAMPVMNRLHGLWSVGTVVGGVIATLAAGAVSLRVHLIAVAVVLAASLVYVAPRLLAEDQRTESGRPGGRPPDGQRAARLARWRVPAVFAAMGSLAIALELTPSDWAAFRLSEDLGVDLDVAGVGFVAATLGMVVGRFAGDWAAARVGRRTMLPVAAATIGGGLLVASVAPWPAVVLVAFFVAGIGNAVVFPALYDQAASAPGRPGAVLGAMTAGIRIGLLALPVAVGSLADLDGVTVGGAMAAITVPAAVALAALGTLVPTHDRAPSP